MDTGPCRIRGGKLKNDWFRAVDAASSIEEVLQAVEEFVESRSDIYWSGVPADLRRPQIDSPASLQKWHHALVQAIARMSSPGSPMQELAVFSLRAAVRLHQLRLKEQPQAPDDDGGWQAAPMPGTRRLH
jgi:hypothetical protein